MKFKKFTGGKYTGTISLSILMKYHSFLLNMKITLPLLLSGLELHHPQHDPFYPENNKIKFLYVSKIILFYNICPIFFLYLGYLFPIDLFLKISAFTITLKLNFWEQQD